MCLKKAVCFERQPLDTPVGAMNIMNCLGSATVPKSLALQSQGWSFAATLRAGLEQRGLILFAVLGDRSLSLNL